MRVDDIGYHHKQEKTFRCNRPDGAGDWLLLLLKTPAYFVIDGTEQLVPPDSFVIFTPHDPLSYRAAADEYIDDWMHFEPTAEEQALIEQLQLPLHRPVRINNCVAASELIQRLCFEHYSAHTNRKETVNLYFRMLLYKLNELMEQEPLDAAFLQPGKYTDKLIWIRTSMFRWPEQYWSAEFFAQELHLSVSRFMHLYTATFGTTMLHDITLGRVTLACRLLEETDFPIDQIAERCGYTGAVYLNQVFHKIMHCTPQQYRRQKRKPQP